MPASRAASRKTLSKEAVQESKSVWVANWTVKVPLDLCASLNSFLRALFQFAPAAGGGMPSAAISKYYSYSNAPSIEVADLTAQMGGSIDVGPSVGFDLLAILNDDKSQSGYVGGALYVGYGLAPYAVEGHGTVSKSYDIFKINLLED